MHIENADESIKTVSSRMKYFGKMKKTVFLAWTIQFNE